MQSTHPELRRVCVLEKHSSSRDIFLHPTQVESRGEMPHPHRVLENRVIFGNVRGNISCMLLISSAHKLHFPRASLRHSRVPWAFVPCSSASLFYMQLDNSLALLNFSVSVPDSSDQSLHKTADCDEWECRLHTKPYRQIKSDSLWQT